MLPDSLHDGDVVKISENCWAEYIFTPAHDGMPERKAFRLANRVGSGVCIEGEDFDRLIHILQRG